MKLLLWQWRPLLGNKDLTNHHPLLRGSSHQMMHYFIMYNGSTGASGYDEDEALARAVAASLQEEEKEKHKRQSQHRNPQPRPQQQRQQVSYEA